MNNNYYKSPEPSWLMRQFWKACGADAYLLQKSTYSDQIKYFCLGGIVVATGVMAAMAGGYAFYTIFAPKDPVTGDLLWSTWVILISSLFGLIWGAIIYNIDRFIVTSTGKGDGTEAITKQELKSAIPRIIMGMIIALTISKPIEIRMFQTEIQTKLTEIKEDKKKENAEKVEKRFLNRLESKDDEILKIENQIDQAEKIYYSLMEDINSLQTGTGKYTGSPCTRGENCPTHSQLYTSKNLAYSNWQKMIKSKSTDLKRLKIERQKIIIDRNQELKNLDINAEGLNGLAIRIKLAEEVAGIWISWFITLLFMVIELTPIFFKMMLVKGPYDYMDDNIKDLARAELGIEVIYNFYKSADELKNDIANSSENQIQKNKMLDGYDVNKVINHAAELKAKERLLIIKAQEELNEEIILKWKLNKLKDIKENPDKYIEEQ